MRAQITASNRDNAQASIALALCAAVVVAALLEPLLGSGPTHAAAFAPNWLPIAAGVLAAAGIVASHGDRGPHWLQTALLWAGLLLMVWAANGLPFDLLRVVRLIPLPVDWAGLVIRALALAAAIMIARLVLAEPSGVPSSSESKPPHIPAWYGLAAFALALPYPALRTHWLLGGTLGLAYPGAAGEGFEAWVISVPWLMAAVLSLLLIPTWRWMPRRLLLLAGWGAVAIVAMIGPAAVWSVVTLLLEGRDAGLVGIALWVPALFYTSWFLWAIAAAAATRSYQLRSAALRKSPPA